MPATSAGMTLLLVRPQKLPIGIAQLGGDELVELAGEHAQLRIAPRIFLVEPTHQDDIGDGGDVPPPVPAPVWGPRLAAQLLVMLEDRLDVLRRAGDDSLLAAVEQELG